MPTIGSRSAHPWSLPQMHFLVLWELLGAQTPRDLRGCQVLTSSPFCPGRREGCPAPPQPPSLWPIAGLCGALAKEKGFPWLLGGGDDSSYPPPPPSLPSPIPPILSLLHSSLLPPSSPPRNDSNQAPGPKQQRPLPRSPCRGPLCPENCGHPTRAPITRGLPHLREERHQAPEKCGWVAGHG